MLGIVALPLGGDWSVVVCDREQGIGFKQNYENNVRRIAVSTAGAGVVVAGVAVYVTH